MKVPYTWLKDYVETDLEPHALAEKLTMAGLEVDHVDRRWHKVVTARILDLAPVEGSDHLNATHVTTAMPEDQVRSVVCGAPNIHAGDIVPLALPGAEVQSETGEIFNIEVTKKRGVLSEGMLCSPRELGLSSDHQGIYLLPPDSPLGQPWEETVIELDIKAHRGDLFSITGIAREVAAFQQQHLHLPSTAVTEDGKIPVQDLARVTVLATDLCPRFTARVISQVKIGPSPLWMVRRLAAAGVRSINNVVDITNYVMLELGQPLHAFDYDQLADHHLIIRRAEQGEHLQTLDGQDRTLTPDMLVIADTRGALSLAGVMGGATSEVTATTTTILLEAANWDPATTRRTSSRLGLRSEASSRYEKGLDSELAIRGLHRAAQLMVELAGGVVAPGIIDVYNQPMTPRVLPFTIRDVEWLLGYPVTQREVVDALTALEFGVEVDGHGSDDSSASSLHTERTKSGRAKNGSKSATARKPIAQGGITPQGESITSRALRVRVPTWRADVREAADLVEEVARVLGYDRIIGHIPTGPLPEPQRLSWFDREERIRDIVAGMGCREVVTYPLTSREATQKILNSDDAAPLLLGALPMPSTPLTSEQLPFVVLANPLSSRMEVLRLTMLPSLLETLAENVGQGATTMRIFEVGRRYFARGLAEEVADPKRPGLPMERPTLGVALCGAAVTGWLATHQFADHLEDMVPNEPMGGGRDFDFFDIKAIAEGLCEELHIQGARYAPIQHPSFHPGRCALLELPETSTIDSGARVYHPAGVLGEIHPEIARRYDLPRRAFALELDLEGLYAAAIAIPHFQSISRYPALTRDLAVVVDSAIPAAAVEACIRAAGGELVREVTLFDLYEGEQVGAGKRSLAFTIVYQARDRTLSAADGDAERAKVLVALKTQLGATIRE